VERRNDVLDLLRREEGRVVRGPGYVGPGST
jgi:hypothetical protein